MRYRALVAVALAGILSAQAHAVSISVDHSSEALPPEATAAVGSDVTSEAAMGPLLIPMEMDLPVALTGDGDNDGYIGSLGITRVPLPGAIWLFGSALIGMLAIGRRRPGRLFS